MKDDKTTPCDNWRKGEVEELTVSKDCTFLLKRPVQRLIPFEKMKNENVPNLIANRQQWKAAVTGKTSRRMNNLCL